MNDRKHQYRQRSATPQPHHHWAYGLLPVLLVVVTALILWRIT